MNRFSPPTKADQQVWLLCDQCLSAQGTHIHRTTNETLCDDCYEKHLIQKEQDQQNQNEPPTTN